MNAYRIRAFRSISLLGFVALALASCLATPPPPTLAWSRLFNTGTMDDFGQVAVDNAGNTYAVRSASQPAPSQTSYTFHLSKILETGGVIDSGPFTYQSPAANLVLGNDGAIYVLVNQLNSGTVLMKFNSNVQEVWRKNFTLGFAGISVEANGLVHLALGRDVPGNVEFAMLTLSSSGVASPTVTTTDIGADGAFYMKPYWVANGFPPGNKGGCKWGVYKEADGTSIGSETTLDTFDKSTGLNTVHVVSVFPYSGSILACVNATTTPLQSTSGPNQFVIGHYTIVSGPGIIRDWTTTPNNGLAGFSCPLQSNNGNLDIYALANPGNLYHSNNQNNDPSTLYLINAQGGIDSATTVPYSNLRLNPTGFFSFESDAGFNSAKIEKHELDPTLPPDWTITVQGTGSVQNAFTTADGVFKNNIFTAALNLGDANTGQDFEVQRYVFGPTLYTVSASPATVKSGGTVTLKVQLTAPAPAGGIAIKMASHDAHLLFPNNGTTFVAGVPAGSIYVNVTMHATTVTSNTVVSVQGNERGVVKGTLITITP